MKKYIRIVSQKELDQIQQFGIIKTSETIWEPYNKNQIVFLFEGKEVNMIFNRYAKCLAEYRKLSKGDQIYVLEISNPPGKIETEQSANSWKESRAHFGNIPVSCVLIVGNSEVTLAQSAYYQLSNLDKYELPKSINTI
jgi:hypothetical protein